MFLAGQGWEFLAFSATGQQDLVLLTPQVKPFRSAPYPMPVPLSLAIVALLFGTRQIEAILDMNYVRGRVNDSDADNLSWVVTAVLEPNSSAALVAIAF